MLELLDGRRSLADRVGFVRDALFVQPLNGIPAGAAFGVNVDLDHIGIQTMPDMSRKHLCLMPESLR